MNIYKELRLNYGPIALQHARHLEGAAIKTATWSNHLTFNHACKKLNVTPSPSLRLYTNVGGQAAERIITSAQRRLLTTRIGQCHERLQRLRLTHQHHNDALTSLLTPQTHADLLTQVGWLYSHAKSSGGRPRWEARPKRGYRWEMSNEGRQVRHKNGCLTRVIPKVVHNEGSGESLTVKNVGGGVSGHPTFRAQVICSLSYFMLKSLEAATLS
jgi:hypothetical protein